MKNIASDLGSDLDCDDSEPSARQRIRRGVCAKGISEQQDHGAQNGGGQNRQCDLEPILTVCRAEVLRGFTPLAFQPIKGNWKNI